jgi:REP element-mobilizing transposase RayT
MEKFRGKYRIKSHRRPNWDYSADGLYFLTLVTQNRVCNLGEIIKTENSAYLELSDFGKIVDEEWFKSFEIREELILHAYILMPNHLHAIVEIKNENRRNTVVDSPVDTHGTPVDTHGPPVDTHGRVYQQGVEEPNLSNEILDNDFDINQIKRNMPIRLPKSISSFIAGFKSAVNTKIDDYIDAHELNIPKYNRKNHFFQPNYHDHIIRNYKEYYFIARYIEHNPMNWNKDSLGKQKFSN